MVAQLLPIDLVAPGFRGVNFEEKQGILPPHWATVASNAVIDAQGRLASRKGYSDVTSVEVTSTPDIKTLHEYRRETAGHQIIVAWDGGIANSIDSPEANDISGVVTDSDGDWWFQNFNDKCIGFINGQKPIVYNGTGNFATVVESSGTAPLVYDGVGLCAFGRVWAVGPDGQTIHFTGLLDETNWGGVGAGTIDMQNIWTRGTDHVRSIVAFNGALVVFGRRHIVFWVDGVGSQLGLNPDNIYVADVIEGTGCESQWSIQQIGDTDLLFMSMHGIQSLSRVVDAGGSNPIGTLTRKVFTEFTSDVAGTGDLTTIRSAVDPQEGFYIVSFPAKSRTWVLHYNKPYQDENTRQLLYPITTWDLAPTAWLRDAGNARLLLGYAGNVGLYGGSDTDNGTAFTFEYESSWLDLGESVANRLKLLKRLGAIVFVQTESTIAFKWDFDFRGTWTSKSKTFESGAGAEWGIAEWGIAEWSGGVSLRIVKMPTTGHGQYIKVGTTIEVNSTVAIQQIELFSKLGRYA